MSVGFRRSCHGNKVGPIFMHQSIMHSFLYSRKLCIIQYLVVRLADGLSEFSFVDLLFVKKQNIFSFTTIANTKVKAILQAHFHSSLPGLTHLLTHISFAFYCPSHPIFLIKKFYLAICHRCQRLGTYGLFLFNIDMKHSITF